MNNKPSIIQVMGQENIFLRRRGMTYITSCPFPNHDDKTPSFVIYPEENRFYCFGCGERGDTIDFIGLYKGLSFKETLSYLEIEENQQWKDAPQLKGTALVKAFRQWENEYHWNLAALYRDIRTLMQGFTNMDQVLKYENIYKNLPVIEEQLEILISKNDETKYRLFKEGPHFV